MAQRHDVADEQRAAERQDEVAQHVGVEIHDGAQDNEAPHALGIRIGRRSVPDCAPMRLVVASCSVEYRGRLGARLSPATRLVLLKSDGSIAVHSDAKAYKPLNWMNPPCTITWHENCITAATPKGETLVIELHEVFADVEHDLGDDPGLEKDGVEAQLQELLAAQVRVLGEDLVLVKREYPTDIGPVDLLCTDAQGHTIAVEIKRVGEIAGVEQLLRYQERLDLDSRFAPTRGMFVAQRFKPQTKVFAESKGIVCVEVDLDRLRGDAVDMTLF